MIRNLGIMVRSDYSGLGNQTRRMVELIRPERVVLIDSSSFSPNSEQHPEWYDSFSGYTIKGFPTDADCYKFLRGLTHFICCENPMNTNFYKIAKSLGVKTFCVVNYEFLDTLNRPNMIEPDYFIMPSYWKIDEMHKKYGHERVIYLPPPLDLNEFKEAREENMRRNGSTLKLLHVVGTLAAHDRNGTLDLIRALSHTSQNLSLTIKSQQLLPSEYMSNDRRISYRFGNEPETQNIYKDFDALILPRRFGGLCLPCNEALASGLPVIMPDISPNNQLLPKEWLVKAAWAGQFQARVPIDYYSIKAEDLAEQIGWLAHQDLSSLKIEAMDLAHREFSESIREGYNQLWEL